MPAEAQPDNSFVDSIPEEEFDDDEEFEDEEEKAEVEAIRAERQKKREINVIEAVNITQEVLNELRHSFLNICLLMLDEGRAADYTDAVHTFVSKAYIHVQWMNDIDNGKFADSLPHYKNAKNRLLPLQDEIFKLAKKTKKRLTEITQSKPQTEDEQREWNKARLILDCFDTLNEIFRTYKDQDLPQKLRSLYEAGNFNNLVNVTAFCQSFHDFAARLFNIKSQCDQLRANQSKNLENYYELEAKLLKATVEQLIGTANSLGLILEALEAGFFYRYIPIFQIEANCRSVGDSVLNDKTEPQVKTEIEYRVNIQNEYQLGRVFFSDRLLLVWLSNACSNARKMFLANHSLDEPFKLVIQVTVNETPEPKLVVRVSDNGRRLDVPRKHFDGKNTGYGGGQPSTGTSMRNLAETIAGKNGQTYLEQSVVLDGTDCVIELPIIDNGMLSKKSS